MAHLKDIHRAPRPVDVTPKPQIALCLSFDPQDVVVASEFLPDAGPVFRAEELEILGCIGGGLPKGDKPVGE